MAPFVATQPVTNHFYFDRTIWNMTEEKTIGRNEACPCGSGKKYKRCCGANAAPKLGVPKAAWPPADLGAAKMPDMSKLPPGFDPSAMDPELMSKVGQAIQRLPKGQIQKLQALMQKAMAGKDVSKEAGVLEQSLPPDLRSMLTAMAPAATEQSGMDEAEARKIVEAAIADGRISKEEADNLVAKPTEENKSTWSKLWKGLKK
jgi:hypothetical protein